MKRAVVFFLFFLCSVVSRSQVDKDSCTLEISLLTCAPGTELYSIFGHTAIRVKDARRGMDVIYNYGTFDDTDPLFYVNFTRGIMLYSVSAQTLDNFMEEYKFEHRSVREQVLNLTCAETNKLYEALRNNTLEENRLYEYHFHTDNCTTRAGRIIESNTGEPLTYKNILPSPGPSYRDMIHEYLELQNQYWPEFGIDMMLGKNLDIKPGNVEAIHFLPDYLYRGIDSADLGSKPLVAGRNTILDFPETKTTYSGLRPMALFISLLLITVLLFIFRANHAIRTCLLIFDIVFFSLLGIIGMIMAYAWLGRVDDVCRNNINILWALPTHLVTVFFIRKRKTWIKYYFLGTAIIAAVLTIGFPWWFQRMNPAVLPLLGIIIFRSYLLSKNRNHAEKSSIQKSAAGV